MRNALISILLSLVPLTVAACGGKKAPEPTTPGTTSSSSTTVAGGQAACVEVMTRGRTCTNEFIPALVDIRAKYNNPEGIADAVKADRNKVISQALQEWSMDSKDDAIARQCERVAASAPDADVETSKGCLTQAECGPFVACIMPVLEKHFVK
ncbi:MAG: hypothetical protein H0T42_00125 [Deltaproteobacteria bacterium]|nr:hypothetical protein [Deltaproteobacteria bacterium]